MEARFCSYPELLECPKTIHCQRRKMAASLPCAMPLLISVGKRSSGWANLGNIVDHLPTIGKRIVFQQTLFHIVVSPTLYFQMDNCGQIVDGTELDGIRLVLA
jgi:hypothetical protein